MRRRAARLIRSLLAIGLVSAGLPAQGENRVASSVSLYTDDDATDVITSVTRVSADTWTGGTIEGSYLIDIITSASVDLVSQATARFEENRHSIGAAINQTLGDVSFGADYGFSLEADYVGHGVGGNVNLALFEENTTLGLDYHLELARIRRADDPTFDESLVTNAVGIAASQILSRRILLDGGYSLVVQNGYTAKPYRYARVQEVVPGACRLCPPETHPDSRLRHALFGGLKVHLIAETAVEARYRLYVDSWAINAHTVDLFAHLGWSRNFGARLRYRFYHQNGASFYQDIYPEPQEYMTGDRELSPLSSHLTGIKLFGRIEDVWIFESIQLGGKFEVFQYDYRDFSRLPRRRGFVAESGLEVVF